MAKANKKTTDGQTTASDVLAPIELALRNANDIVIKLDDANIVQNVYVNPNCKSFGDLSHWQGSHIQDLVTVESKPKLERRLSASPNSIHSSQDNVEINHIDKADGEFPIRYTIQSNGLGKGSILVGRDLQSVAVAQQQLVRAQIALEREYEKNRDFETRYRVLRDNLTDALLFVDASNGRIVDANPLSAKLLGVKVDGLIGLSLESIFQEGEAQRLTDKMISTASEKDSDPILATAVQSKDAIKLTPILFRSAGDMIILCRLNAVTRGEPATEDLLSALKTLYRHGADAIVFTDRRGVIRDANESFLALCDVVQVTDVRGKMLGDYLLRGAIDQKVLLEAATASGRLKLFSTKLMTASGGENAVEIAATHLGDHSDAYFGIVIRDGSHAASSDDPTSNDDAMQNAMELVGTAPLKELVAATADVVEKMCIETAVKLTDNNRVEAAELLGLSRQSFYVRLRKYGLLKRDED